MIAGALDCTIDSLFGMSDLVILDAWFGDGLEKRSVATRLTRYIENDSINIVVSPNVFGETLSGDRVFYLTVKYRVPSGVYYACARQNDSLYICAQGGGYSLDGEKLKIIAASYGNANMYGDVMRKVKRYSVFNWNGYPANDALFPSDPMNDGEEYLTLVYINHEGINMTACKEGESIDYSRDGTALFRKKRLDAAERFIPNVEELPRIGRRGRRIIPAPCNIRNLA